MLLGFDLLKQVNAVETRQSGQQRHQRSLPTQMLQFCWTQTSRDSMVRCNAISSLDFLCGVFSSQGFEYKMLATAHLILRST